jgi:hypothetical protein
MNAQVFKDRLLFYDTKTNPAAFHVIGNLGSMYENTTAYGVLFVQGQWQEPINFEYRYYAPTGTYLTSSSITGMATISVPDGHSVFISK